MNIDVVGRVRPSLRGEGPCNLELDGNRLADRPGGTYYSFDRIYRQEASNFDIYKNSLEPLLDLSLAGFNICILVVGESHAGKSYTVAGDLMSKSGLVPILMDDLFNKIGDVNRQGFEGRSASFKQVTLQMCEIYNENVKDLLEIPGVKSENHDLEDTAADGPKLVGGTVIPVTQASEATAYFRQAWARRTNTDTDYGSARNYSSVILHIDISLKSGQNPMPNKSRISVVVVPGTEKLAEDSSQIRLREGPTLSKGVVSLSQLVASLAHQPYADRVVNYGNSKLTEMLKEELGGNFKTRVIMCFRPETDSYVVAPMLRLASQFNKVNNFPVLNDSFAQQLITQYRARIINLQQQLGLGLKQQTNNVDIHDMQSELRRIQTENLELRDRNETLHQKLEKLQGKFGTLATTKADISSQLLMTEEEKLKVSKMLLEMQIENNQIREESEASKFELTNKILQLEHDLTEAELQRDKFSRNSRNYKEKLDQVEKDRKDLADEYIVLKTNHLAMTTAHEKEMSRNEELSMELLNLVNSNQALLRQMQTLEMVANVSGANMDDLERVRALASRKYNKNKDQYNQSVMEEDRLRMEKNLFGNQERFDSEMDKVRNQYDDAQRKLQIKLAGLTRELNESRNIAREKQRKYAELNAQVLSLRNAHDHLQLQNNQLQHKLKDINDDFRSRLVKYLEDVAQYIDSDGGASTKKKSEEQMRQYVNSMIKDLKKAHHVREEQLSTAAQGYKQQLQQVVRKHEELLVAYRELREQVEARGLDDLDLGPDEHKLQITDASLQSAQQKEINRLREDLTQALTELEAEKLRARMEAVGHGSGDKHDGVSRSKEDWSGLRKQLKEFTLNTQQELEQERAQLLTKNAMLEEELLQYKSYIDNHLAKYKDEVVKLRRQLGMEGNKGFSSPDQRSRKNQWL